ncbi:hypothetical protein B0H19DRAFT_1065982 [Mycena capillaripes]|nr:hypothetical protein B0H19DRAFT_1065982 [Mycena capillaripes]
MPIIQLPVELVVKILHGMALKDIMSMARSCTYFRHISLDNRQLWVDAKDSSKLPLPVDETLNTVDATLLPRLACRAILLEQKWDEHIIVPIRSVEPSIIYTLPTWTLWVPPTEEASIMSVEWVVIDKKIQVGLLLRAGRWSGNAESLCIFEVPQNWPEGGSVTAPKFYTIPPESKGFSMHHSTALIWGPEFLFLLDLVTGKEVYLYCTEDVPPITIIYAALHPELPLKAVLLSGNRDSRINPIRGLEVVENISQAPHAPSIARNNRWDTRLLARRFIEIIEASDDSEPSQRLNKRKSECFRLRTHGNTGTIADINTRSIAPMYSLQSCVEEPKSIIPINARPAALAEDCRQFWLCETGSGPPFMFMRRGDRIEFCRYSPESGSMDRIKSLDPETTRFIPHDEVLEVSFDPTYGKLILLVGDRVKPKSGDSDGGKFRRIQALLLYVWPKQAPRRWLEDEPKMGFAEVSLR